MKALRFEGKKDLPEVDFDPSSGQLNMGGKSYPSDVRVFYNPLIEWLTEYAASRPPKTEFHFRFEYFNTATSKIIVGLIDALKPLEDLGTLQIYWHYPIDDPDMQEFGEVLEDICKVGVEYVEDDYYEED